MSAEKVGVRDEEKREGENSETSLWYEPVRVLRLLTRE